MRLNSFGRIAEKQWHWLAHQYPYVALHAFVVMPNHIHGIMQINRSMIDDSNNHANVRGVGTGRDLSLHHEHHEHDEQHHPIKIKSLSQLIGAYKTTTSKQIHLAGNTQFAWQRSFHDHIIKNNTAYWNIYDYIANNPKQWKGDCFFEFQ